MRYWSICVATGLLVTLGSIGSALAQSAADNADRWGLIGTWRLEGADCAAPIAPGSPDLIYVVRDGKLFHDRDYGGARDSNPVTAAVIRGDGSLEVTARFSQQLRRFLFAKRADGLKRAMYNYNVATEEYSVRDGKFVANGNETPWQKRCRHSNVNASCTALCTAPPTIGPPPAT